MSALTLYCDGCLAELAAPGALLFGIPDAMTDCPVPVTAKRHLCRQCYVNVLHLLDNTPVSEAPDDH